MVSPIRYRFSAVVKTVEERFEQIWVSGTQKDAVFRDNSLGWWVIFQGWPSAMFFGAEQPDFEAGDVIDMTARKRSPGQPVTSAPAPLKLSPAEAEP